MKTSLIQSVIELSPLCIIMLRVAGSRETIGLALFGRFATDWSIHKCSWRGEEGGPTPKIKPQQNDVAAVVLTGEIIIVVVCVVVVVVVVVIIIISSIIVIITVVVVVVILIATTRTTTNKIIIIIIIILIIATITTRTAIIIMGVCVNVSWSMSSTSDFFFPDS